MVKHKGINMDNEKKVPYMINMQKLLHIAGELHKRGYENLRVVPCLSPNGMAWRCKFDISGDKGRSHSDKDIYFVRASNWIRNFDEEREEIKLSIQELSDLFEKEHRIFLEKCKGDNQEYVEWYNEMLNKLQEGELPYAFSDYFHATDFWETSSGNKINILPNMKNNGY